MNDRKSRRFSAPGQTPTSATFTVVDREWEDLEQKGTDSKEDYDSWWKQEEEFEKEKKAIARSGSVVHEKRKQMSRGAIMDIKVARWYLLGSKYALMEIVVLKKNWIPIFFFRLISFFFSFFRHTRTLTNIFHLPYGKPHHATLITHTYDSTHTYLHYNPLLISLYL